MKSLEEYLLIFGLHFAKRNEEQSDAAKIVLLTINTMCCDIVTEITQKIKFT